MTNPATSKARARVRPLRRGSAWRRAWVLSIVIGLVAPLPGARPEAGGDRVVVLHGLMRHARHTRALAKHLESEGYEVTNLSYRSRRPIEAIAGELNRAIGACCRAPSGRVHFVAHSLGSIVVRRYLETERPANLGRVVMLGPPNQGSEVIDRMPRALMRWVAGPAALQLGTDEASVPRALGPVDYDVGVIAGDRSIKRRQSRWIPGDDDGMVSVESTRVDGMRDHIVLPVHHQQLVKSPAVAAQVSHFLRNGRFDRRAASSVD